ncbi:unnamed protein product [Malus baccata var. baccata]
MATESPIRMSETSGKWAPRKKTAKLAPSSANMAAEELKLLLRGHKFQSSGQDVSPNRSGSAPPSMEGSFLAIDNLLSQQDSSMNGSLATLGSVIERCETEEQLRADPAYLAYYCANVNLNPRLPRPLISWENRRLARNIGSFSQSRGPVDGSGNFLLHMSQGSLPTHKEESEDDQSSQLFSNDWVDQTSEVWLGEGAASLVGQHQNVGDLIQEDFGCSSPPVPNHSHALGKEVPEEFNDHSTDSSSMHDPAINVTTTIKPSVDAETADATALSPNDDSSPTSEISRSTAVNDASVAVIESEMKALNISDLIENQKKQEQWERSCQNHFLQQHQQQNNFFQVQSGKSQITSQGTDGTYVSMDQYLHNTSKYAADVQPVHQTSGFTPPLYATAAYMNSANPYYSNIQGPGFLTPPYLSGYTLNPTAFSPYIGGYHPPGAVPVVVDGTVGPSFNARTSGVATGGILSPGADMQHSSKFYGQLGYPLQTSFSEPMYMQYHQQPFVDSYGGPRQFDPLASRGGVDSKKVSSHGSYLDEHKSQHQRIGNMGNLNPQRGGSMTPNYLGSAPNVGILMQYPTPPLTSPVSPVPLIGSGINTGLYPAWPRHRGFESYDDPKIYNFLEELKSGKGRRFELSDITGHIVEFSADQHGSRFIQQKLENCSVEEKASVFKEVLPHASKLMTDVFGNYVIQKFFEYGTPQQRKELANQLSGQILPLSLQMYGCRVIQKALEVIELEQKVQLVHELDGHVMRCVRDQNGNHVIQKCIESIPTEKIRFIISAFRGQVATLSIHPYGCRVIQRVLEHCTDELQCQFIVDEILESVAGLAQDQYGNYVTQHVLERGKPNERRKIINKLSGHFVPLSQHKFASNVVEKCLEYGGAAELELLIREIVGHNEGNDNLLVMMKDQYANYVVQKTLEICNDSQRVLLINRIRAHTNALKKYTYGKHIVARFEQLFGEENLSGS